jgi:hypothetical protein
VDATGDAVWTAPTVNGNSSEINCYRYLEVNRFFVDMMLSWLFLINALLAMICTPFAYEDIVIQPEKMLPALALLFPVFERFNRKLSCDTPGRRSL